MSKTIKQIADEIGVSKTAVRKKMKVLFENDTGNQFAETVSGVVYISVSGETLIKSAFLNSIGNQLPETVSGKVSSEVSSEVSGWFAVVDALKLQMGMLQEELKIKNDQIKELNTRLAEAHQMVEKAQNLHGADKVLELHNGQPPQFTESNKPSLANRFKYLFKGEK